MLKHSLGGGGYAGRAVLESTMSIIIQTDGVYARLESKNRDQPSLLPTKPPCLHPRRGSAGAAPGNAKDALGSASDGCSGPHLHALPRRKSVLIQGKIAHKKTPARLGPPGTLGIGLRLDALGGRFLMSEVPLYRLRMGP